MDLQQLKIERENPRRGARVGRTSGWTKLLVAVVLMAAIGFLFQRQILALVDRVRLPLVKTQRVTVTSQSAAAAVAGTSGNGYVVARTRAALSADTPGRIVELNVQEGSVVKKGDVVARLFADEYAASLRRAEADLAVADAGSVRAAADVVTAERNLDALKSALAASEADVTQHDAGLRLAQLSFERARKLLEDRVDTQDRVDRAQRDLDEAASRVAWARARVQGSKDAIAQGEAQLASMRAAVAEADARVVAARAARDLAAATLDKTTVRAPFDGVVVLKDAEVGEVVSPNVQGGSSARGSVATMVDWSSLEVQVELQETSLAAAIEGAPVSIFLDAWPDRRYAGKVRRLWPTANRQKATVEVRVTFDAPDDHLRPEMGARVVFAASEPSAGAAEAQSAPVTLVPKSAIVRAGGVESVFVVERDVVSLRRVTLGGERSGRVVVTSGVADGERIVDEPPPTLADADRVRIQE